MVCGLNVTNEEDEVYSALFNSPTSDFFCDGPGEYTSDIHLDDLIEKTGFSEKVIMNSLKGLIKKKYIEHNVDCEDLELKFIPYFE